MQKFAQDKLIFSEKITKFDISYPIYIIGWEIRQVQNINKLYVVVFYKKLVCDVKAAKIKLKFISEFNEVIQEEIKTINDIDKKSYEFFEIYPLHIDTRKLEVNIIQALCLDGENVANLQPIIVSNDFFPFDEKIKCGVGQDIIPSAKGYPQENESCWICCCGEINAKSSESCIACKSQKKDVFEMITEKNIKEKSDMYSFSNNEKKERDENVQEPQIIKSIINIKAIAIFSICIALMVVFMFLIYYCVVPHKKTKKEGFAFSKFDNTYLLIKYNDLDLFCDIHTQICNDFIIKA